MPIELDLPDLPPLTIGAAAPAVPQVRQPLGYRIRESLSAYLPIVLMALLALSTWWLVQNTPLGDVPDVAVPPRHEPDYTMERFSLKRFGTDGRLAVQLDGDRMRHYPDTDTLEIDGVRLRATDAKGGITLANATRALVNGDASEVQLLGGAHITNEAAAGGDVIEFRGEFLHAFLNTEQVRSHLPVVVRRGSSEMRAGGLVYDNLSRTVQLQGRVRAVFMPPARKG